LGVIIQWFYGETDDELIGQRILEHPISRQTRGVFFCSHGYNGYNKFIPLTNHEINPVGFQPLTYYNEAPLTVSSLKKKLDLESSLAATKW
jgi:hypothetical protein